MGHRPDHCFQRTVSAATKVRILGYKSQNQYEAEMEKLKDVTQLEYPVLLDQIIAKCQGVLGPEQGAMI